MTSRSRRFVFQGSGVAFAAVVAASMPASNHATVAAAPATTQASVSASGNISGRHAMAAHFVGFDAGDTTGMDIRHRWP